MRQSGSAPTPPMTSTVIGKHQRSAFWLRVGALRIVEQLIGGTLARIRLYVALSLGLVAPSANGWLGSWVFVI